MAKKYVITADYDTIVAQVAAALADYYGAGVTVHYTSATVIVFSCAAISDKVIKMELVSAEFKLYYGDAWTSGTTITNQVTIQLASNGTATTDCYLLLYTTYLCFVDTNTNDGTWWLIAKTSNNRFVCLSFTISTVGSYSGWRYGYTTDGNRVYLFPLSINIEIKHPTGYLLKFPIMLHDGNGHLCLNSDGSAETIADIYLTPALAADIYLSSEVFAKRGPNNYNNMAAFSTTSCSLLIELDAEV